MYRGSTKHMSDPIPMYICPMDSVHRKVKTYTFRSVKDRDAKVPYVVSLLCLRCSVDRVPTYYTNIQGCGVVVALPRLRLRLRLRPLFFIIATCPIGSDSDFDSHYKSCIVTTSPGDSWLRLRNPANMHCWTATVQGDRFGGCLFLRIGMIIIQISYSNRNRIFTCTP